MNRPEAVRAVRMFLHYDRVEDTRSYAEYDAREARREYYQELVYSLCPTDTEILAGCGGVENHAAETIRDMLSTYADYARKGGG